MKLIIALLAQWSGIGTVDGRGKLNGSVASKNKGGNYWRTKVTPTNPRSAAQSQVRSNMSYVSRAWKELDAVDRDAWNSIADSFPYTNIFGETKTLSGFAFWTKLNMNKMQNGSGTLYDMPPTMDGPVGLTLGAVEIVATGDQFDVNLTGTASGNSTWVFASKPVSNGVGATPSGMKFIKFVSGVTTTIDIFAAYTAIFGSLPAAGTKKIFVGIVSCNNTSSLTNVMTSVGTIVQ